jgi:release factor glutamine methyltransferase
MLISELKTRFLEKLGSDYPLTEAESFFYILTEHYLGKRRIDIAMDPGFELVQEQQIKFENALERLKDHEPVQYITGTAEFFGLDFRVNKNVLIPRPETEGLVEWIISDFKDSGKALKILDIGTGSGCIPICLAKELIGSKVSSYDISTNALALARENAASNNAKVKFERLNILETDSLPNKFDIIVSNPPYVRELEKEEMQKNVLDFEPEQALYVSDDDALVFYRKITKLATESLEENGALYFEINQYLSKETKALVEKYGFETVLKKDIFGNYRMLKAWKK